MEGRANNIYSIQLHSQQSQGWDLLPGSKALIRFCNFPEKKKSLQFHLVLKESKKDFPCVHCSLGVVSKIQIRVRTSRLTNVGEICVWRLVPPVGHCNSLYLGSGKRQNWWFSQEDLDTLGPSKYRYYVFHLSNEPFLKNVSDLEVVDIHLLLFMFPDFNVL